MRIIVCFFCLFFSVMCNSQSQYKYEKESRISEEAFPKEALRFLKEVLPSNLSKIKYYSEQDSLKQSFEAKFKLNKKRFSVEFDTQGILEDIEITIKKKELPKATLDSMQSYFETNFDKVRYKKIQIQFRNTSASNDPYSFKKVFFAETNQRHYYEIIAEVKKDSKRDFIEITFDAVGKFINYRTVKSSSYEHILY